MRHDTTRGTIRGGGFAAAALLLLAAQQASAQQLTAAALEKWLTGYERAWEQRDANAAAELFTPNASYHEMPFEAPKAGQAGIREYWAQVTADQRDIDFKSQVISVTGQTGVAHWSATLRHSRRPPWNRTFRKYRANCRRPVRPIGSETCGTRWRAGSSVSPARHTRRPTPLRRPARSNQRTG